MGIVEENILQDWTEGTQDKSVSLERYLIITDQCYIRETFLFKDIFKTGAAFGVVITFVYCIKCSLYKLCAGTTDLHGLFTLLINTG